jgi:uncharacterized protein YoxC
MMIISLAAAVVAATMVLLAAVLIPAIVELRKTAVATREFITKTDAELQPILKELHETLTDMKALTGGMAENADDLKCFMGAVGETGRGLHTISSVVGAVAGVMGTSSLWLTGVKVAGKFLLDKLAKKGR